MTARILYSRPIADRLKEEIKAECLAFKALGANPALSCFIAGSSGPSMAYAKSKQKACEALGIRYILKVFDSEAKESLLIQEVKKAGADPSIHGIILELPLPKHIDALKAVSEIAPEKDADGLNPANRGLLLSGRLDQALLPVAPLSCIALIEHTGIELSGKSCAVIGRGETVGLPLAVLLIRKHATVTVCHTRTKNLREIVKNSDIIVSASGKPGLIAKDMLSEGQIAIDAGIAVLPDGKTVGDADPGAREKAAWLSPVPGGVGALTVMLLLKNLMKAAKLQTGRSEQSPKG